MSMSYDAYYNINDSNWINIDYNTTNVTIDANSIKAYLFTDISNNNNVIAIKGTSINLLSMIKTHIQSITNSTVRNDRLNDNLYFSCCFYKQNKLFDDYTSNCSNDNTSQNTCSKLCYQESLNYNFNYIHQIITIIDNIKKLIDFDNSNVIFTGHSLGGGIASVMGIKYNKPVVTFDSPGIKHYLDLINLDYINKDTNIYNFGHTADSIMHGHCGTLCKIWGYNIETECHIGNTCIYDSKKKLGYFDSIRYHQLKWIIDRILPHWKDDFPECIYNNPCTERNCKKWEYI
jgi:lipase ATG15